MLKLKLLTLLWLLFVGGGFAQNNNAKAPYLGALEVGKPLPVYEPRK